MLLARQHHCMIDYFLRLSSCSSIRPNLLNWRTRDSVILIDVKFAACSRTKNRTKLLADQSPELVANEFQASAVDDGLVSHARDRVQARRIGIGTRQKLTRRFLDEFLRCERQDAVEPNRAPVSERAILRW